VAQERIFVKKLVAAALLCLSLSTISLASQPSRTNDENAIRATVTDYIQGYYYGDAARMEKSLHPHYLKHTVSGSDNDVHMTERTGLQMVQDIRAQGKHEPPANQKQEITVLDVTDDIASAKLVTNKWVDYMMLAKSNGEWKIVSVLLRENAK
jgi:hypothetical protein